MTRVANNVVARTQLGAARRIVLGGHLDTVPPNGNATPRRDGDTLHGLGAADMKSGLAAMLRLADQLAGGGSPRFDVTLVWYEAEEVADEHNGLRLLFADAPQLVAGDFAILLEPTGGWVEAGCQGSLHVEALFRGRAPTRPAPGWARTPCTKPRRHSRGSPRTRPPSRSSTASSSARRCRW